MSQVFIRKLEAYGPLPEDDKALIRSLAGSPKPVSPHTDLIREGEVPVDVNLVIEGFAYRYKSLPNGARQIVGYLIPGDFCDLHVALLGEMDHTIATLTEARIVKLPRRGILELLDRPAISRSMLMATLVDEATLREWLANIGQRPAELRLAHFFCEWHRRLKVIAMVSGDTCELPITQTELAETVGLSTVHVNRSLQSLRDKGLIILKSRRLILPDMTALCEICGFRANYLHLVPA